MEKHPGAFGSLSVSGDVGNDHCGHLRPSAPQLLTSTSLSDLKERFEQEDMATNGVNGHTNGTNGLQKGLEGYSIPQETQKILENGILNNPLIAHNLPKGITEAAAKVRFEGSDKPSIPINWRFAESISALKGFEAAMVNVLLQRKYNILPQEAIINTLATASLLYSIVY